MQRGYSQCLQTLIVGLENALDDPGPPAVPDRTLAPSSMSTIRSGWMPTRTETATRTVTGGVLAERSARQIFRPRLGRGGDAVYMQQQQFSLAALAARCGGPLRETGGALLPAPTDPGATMTSCPRRFTPMTERTPCRLPVPIAEGMADRLVLTPGAGAPG